MTRFLKVNKALTNCMKTSSLTEERDASSACAGTEPIAMLLGKAPQVRAVHPAGQKNQAENVGKAVLS